ncbi:MAG: BMP family ABC transporter substrate-binding protein [Spirochaetia bacterium]|nr:BMP family ABC transporter substrate-binding protein [Spirochaetia bacterium]
MKKLLTILLVSSLALTSIFAQGKSEEATSTKEKGIGDLKIVLILPGPINDQSWNATNYAGLVACNDQLGTKMEYLENVQASDYESTFRNYAERGYDLIMAAGTQFDDAANKIAGEYPDSTFCVVNGFRADYANVSPIFPKEYEASYIAALIAGEVTKNGKFATIGGFPNEAMEKLLDVYEYVSVELAQERGISNSSATRSYANSWSDIALGKQMAETMIDNGADTLFVYANQVGLGAIQAAKEKGVKFVGFSSNQNDTAPGTVVASVLFNFQTFYTWAVQKYFEGTLDGGKVHEAGIKENIFKPIYTDQISESVRAKISAGIDSAVAGNVDFQSMFK